MGYYAFLRFSENPFIGKGLGDFVKYKIFLNLKVPNFYIDNSWMYLLWKMGIIGFLIYTIIIFRMLKTSLTIYKKSSNLYNKALSLGIFWGLIGLIFLGFLSPIMFKYKSNFIFAILIAYLEYTRLRIDGTKNV